MLSVASTSQAATVGVRPATMIEMLNAIARALSATHDEEGVVSALLTTLSALIPVDQVELAVRPDPGGSRLRLLEGGGADKVKRSWVPVGSRRLSRGRQVLDTGDGHLEEDCGPGAAYRSSAVVPIVEGGAVRGVLATHTHQPDAYERSTLAFLQQVADQWKALQAFGNPGRRLLGALLTPGGDDAQAFWAWRNWCARGGPFRTVARVGGRVVTGPAFTDSPFGVDPGSPSTLAPSFGHS